MNKIWAFLKGIPQVAQLLLVAVVVFLITNVVTGWNTKTEIQSYIDKYKVFQTETQKTVKMLDSVKKVVGKKDQEMIRYIVEANDARAEVARLKAALPDPKVIADLKTKIDSLKAATSDSVVLARTVIPAQDMLIKQQDSTIVIQKFSMLAKDNENIALRKWNGDLTSENTTLKTALDSARTNLNNIPKPPKNPDKIFFGLISKPTRVQSAVVGFGVGVLTIVTLNHYTK